MAAIADTQRKFGFRCRLCHIGAYCTVGEIVSTMAIATKEITVDALTWYYRVTETPDTDRPPILFLHGLPTHSYCWRGLLKRMESAGFYCIAPDWIGSGFSSQPNKRDFSYQASAFQAALKTFLVALGISRCHIVTQGVLGHVGILFALNEPERCDRLVILNSPILPGSKLPWKMQQWGLPLAGEMLTQDPLLVDRTLEGGSGFVISDEDLGRHRKPYKTTSAVGRALASTIRNLNLPPVLTELSDGLKQRTNPTLYIWGAQDPWFDSEQIADWVKAETNHRWVSLAEAKHYPQEHFTKEIAPYLSEFLG